MPKHLKFELVTVRGGYGKPQQVRCSCDDFWSVAQQRAMLELYPRKVKYEPKLNRAVPHRPTDERGHRGVEGHRSRGKAG